MCWWLPFPFTCSIFMHPLSLSLALLHCFLFNIICLSCVALLLSFASAAAFANLNALALFSFSLWYFYFGVFLFAMQQPFCVVFICSSISSVFPHLSVAMYVALWSGYIRCWWYFSPKTPHNLKAVLACTNAHTHAYLSSIKRTWNIRECVVTRLLLLGEKWH